MRRNDEPDITFEEILAVLEILKCVGFVEEVECDCPESSPAACRICHEEEEAYVAKEGKKGV